MSEIGSLLFYLIAFAISTFLVVYGSRKSTRVFAWIGILIPILVSGLRSYVGTDYGTYEAMYQELGSLSLPEYLQSFAELYEIGAYWFASLSYTITNNATLFYFLFSILTVVFFYMGLQRFGIKNRWLVYFLFLMTVFPMSFNIMRQTLAMSIMFYAASFIMERRFVKYILLIIFATCFHKTALIALPAYLMSFFIKKDTRISVRLAIMTTIFSAGLILLTPVMINILFGSVDFLDKFVKYNDSDQVSSGVVLIAKLIMFIFTIVVCIKAEYKKPNAAMIMILAAIELSLTIAALYSINISRISLYFSLFSIVFYTYVTQVFRSKSLRFLMYIVIVSYAVTYFIVAYYMLNGSEIFPYNVVINRGIS